MMFQNVKEHPRKPTYHMSTIYGDETVTAERLGRREHQGRRSDHQQNREPRVPLGCLP